MGLQRVRHDLVIKQQQSLSQKSVIRLFFEVCLLGLLYVPVLKITGSGSETTDLIKANQKPTSSGADNVLERRGDI